MVATTRRPNPDTPARWEAALARAHANHIQVFADRETGQSFALSSDATKLYAVDYYRCSCAAGVGSDPVCQHRAIYREMLRAEDALIAAAVIPEATPTMPQHLIDLFVELDETGEPSGSDLLEPIEPDHRMCTDCLDSGWARMYLGYGLNDYTEVPCGCGVGVAAVA